MSSNYGNYELNKKISEAFKIKIYEKGLLEMAIEYFDLWAKCRYDEVEKYPENHKKIIEHLPFIWEKMDIFNETTDVSNMDANQYYEYADDYAKSVFKKEFKDYLKELTREKSLLEKGVELFKLWSRGDLSYFNYHKENPKIDTATYFILAYSSPLPSLTLSQSGCLRCIYLNSHCYS